MKQNLHTSVWKCCMLTLLCSYFSFASFGQYTENSAHFEAGFTIGPSNFLGDLGGNYGKGTTFLKDNNIQMTKMTVGGFVSYHPIDWLSFRLAINIGSLEGDDAIIKGKGSWEEYRKIRNSNFRSKFSEAILLAEFYPTVFMEFDPSDVYRKFRPYATLGIGAFHFNPEGIDPLTGNWVYLQPLHTEGQGFSEFPDRKEYKLTQINIPMGLGIKYFLNENVNISMEVIHRQTFTDYIDDVSTRYIDPALFYANLPLPTAQLAERMANKTGTPLSRVYSAGQIRGTPDNNDAYYSVGFKVGFRLGGGNKWGNSTNCPIRF